MSKRNIYFGSLEDQLSSHEPESQIQEQVSAQGVSNDSSNFKHPQNFDNPQSHQNSLPQPQLSAASEEFDRRALAKTLQIPTDDAAVRQLLISLNQPITLFGEGPGERRDRLRMMASKAICSLPRAFELFPVLRTLCGGGQPGSAHKNELAADDSDDDDNEEFYVPGSVDLVQIRSFLLEDSIRRSQTRKSLPPIEHTIEHVTRTALYEKIDKELDLKATFMDPNGRPLSTCAFTSNGDLVTGDWSGRVIKYTETTGKSEAIFNAGDRITAMCSGIEGNVLFGTATGKIYCNNHVLSLPTTHAIKSLNWHPSNRFFASSSSDSLWRLWDARDDPREVQVQEGHLGGISSSAWHPDGAIYATAGTSDGLIRLWDCRMGKAIWTISCQSKVAISALTFSPLTPHLFASANADGLVNFHDMRRVESEYMKSAAHRSCCSGLKFSSDGRILVSSGFDGSVRLWCPGDLRLIKDLPVSTSKVTGLDVTDDSKGIRVAAITFDRSVKIFSAA